MTTLEQSGHDDDRAVVTRCLPAGMTAAGRPRDRAARRPSAHVSARPATIGAVLEVIHPRFFRRAPDRRRHRPRRGYMDGDWSTPDLVTLVRLMIRNRRVAERADQALAGVADAADRRPRPPLRDNSLQRQPPQHPPALRPRQRVLPPVPRPRPADVFVRLLRHGRAIRSRPRRSQGSIASVEAATRSRAITCSRSAAAGAASRCGPRRATAAA